MKKEITNNPNIFGCRTIELIPGIIFFTIASIFFLPGAIAFFESMVEPGQPKNFWDFLVCCFSIIYIIASILVYIANKKSSIEVSDTCLIIQKPVNYPFFRMETILIPYNEIESLNHSFGFYRFFGEHIAITKNVGYDQDGTIKFFGLSDILGFFNMIGEKFAEEQKKEYEQHKEDIEKDEEYNEEDLLKEYGEKLHDYKIYRRKLDRFSRIIFIILAVITFVFIVTAPLGILAVLVIVGDIRKCRSYIEFTDSHVNISTYKGDVFGKKIKLEIPYNEISEVKYFDYYGNSVDNTGCNFNIYFKNNEKMESFTIDKHSDVVDLYLIEYILDKQNIKFDIHSNG